MTMLARNQHRTDPDRRASRGQVVVIFAGAMVLFVLLAAVVIDVSWYWANTLRMQRAADAAALAGVVYLPGNPSLAISTARAEAVKNGYTNGVGGISVTPVQDPSNSRRLRVNVSGPVGTYFARVIGITSWHASRDAKADFVLPVPMGSPQNYYGVGTLKGTTVSTTTTHNYNSRNSGLAVATTSPAGTPWVASTGTLVAAVNSSNAAYDYTTTNNATQQFGGFGLNDRSPSRGVDQRQHHRPPGHADQGVGVGGVCHDEDRRRPLVGRRHDVDVGRRPDRRAHDDHRPNTTFGTTSATTFWTGHTTWTASDISNANFRVRLTGIKGCATAGTQIRLDQLQVQAWYTTDNPTTTTTVNADPTARNVNDPSTGSAA